MARARVRGGPRTPRRCWVGTASSARSAVSGNSDDTAIGSGRRMPGRCGFSRLAAIVAARVGSRAHRVTLLPARAACIASAVPQAPAPITATLLIDDAPDCGDLARFAIAQPVEQSRQDRRNLLFEAPGRVDHQHAAAVEPCGIDRLAQA